MAAKLVDNEVIVMMEIIAGLLIGGSVLDTIAFLAAINSIIVQVMKNILPEEFPTKALALITAILVVIGYIFVFGVMSAQMIVLGIVTAFVVAFASMFGFDSLRDAFIRFKTSEKDSGGED